MEKSTFFELSVQRSVARRIQVETDREIYVFLNFLVPATICYRGSALSQFHEWRARRKVKQTTLRKLPSLPGAASTQRRACLACTEPVLGIEECAFVWMRFPPMATRPWCVRRRCVACDRARAAVSESSSRRSAPRPSGAAGSRSPERHHIGGQRHMEP